MLRVIWSLRYWIRPLILTDSSNDAVLLCLISTQKLLYNLLAGKNMSVYINPGCKFFSFRLCFMHRLCAREGLLLIGSLLLTSTKRLHMRFHKFLFYSKLSLSLEVPSWSNPYASLNVLSQSPELHEKAWGLLKVTLMKLQAKYHSHRALYVQISE
jgi:hypothetical protein